MAVIINEIRLPINENAAEALKLGVKLLGVNKQDIESSYIVKTSVDARHRGNISMVYSVGIELRDRSREAAVVSKAASKNILLRNLNQKLSDYIVTGNEKMNCRPVVVGFGPAGMFTALILSKMGYRPIVIERGPDVDKRASEVKRFFINGELNTEANVQFGEGGAGTFSDGKLVTRINDARCEIVLDEFVRHGAPMEIKRIAKPHIGTDKLRDIVKSIRKEIIENGGEVRFETKLESIGIINGKVESIVLSGGEELKTNILILAIGHSARDTFETLLTEGIILQPKPFSVGVRIEHLQSEIDKALYGSLAGHPSLPKGEYQLSYRQDSRAVYTFCMCPGGTVVAAASEEGGVVTNGMSVYSRDGVNANAALAVSVSPEDYGSAPLDGIVFQRKLEKAAFTAAGSSYKAPFQTVNAFLEDKKQFKTGHVLPTYPIGVEPCNLSDILPPFVSAMMKTGLRVLDRKLHGFASDEAVLTGVETRTSSPVRIPRSESFEAEKIKGLYPCGEGAGYAGGITSAAVDGLRVAEAVISRYKPM